LQWARSFSFAVVVAPELLRSALRMRTDRWIADEPLADRV